MAKDEGGGKKKMKKKAFILLSVCMAFLVFASFAQAGSKLKLFVNGKNIESDVPVQIIQNRGDGSGTGNSGGFRRKSYVG